MPNSDVVFCTSPHTLLARTSALCTELGPVWAAVLACAPPPRSNCSNTYGARAEGTTKREFGKKEKYDKKRNEIRAISTVYCLRWPHEPPSPFVCDIAPEAQRTSSPHMEICDSTTSTASLPVDTPQTASPKKLPRPVRASPTCQRDSKHVRA